MTATIPGQRGEGRETWPLVEAAQAGDRAAFGELYRLYRHPIYKFVWWRLGGGSMMRTVAEDLTSLVFTRALVRISTVEYQGRDIWAWLVTIARNVVTDEMKSSRAQRVTSVGELPDDGGELSVMDEPHVVATRNDLRRAVEGELCRMVPLQATAIRLRYLAEFTIAETAAAMGVTAGAVKALTYRGLATLRRHGRLEAYR